MQTRHILHIILDSLLHFHHPDLELIFWFSRRLNQSVSLDWKWLNRKKPSPTAVQAKNKKQNKNVQVFMYRK